MLEELHGQLSAAIDNNNTQTRRHREGGLAEGLGEGLEPLHHEPLHQSPRYHVFFTAFNNSPSIAGDPYIPPDIYIPMTLPADNLPFYFTCYNNRFTVNVYKIEKGRSVRVSSTG